MATPSFPTSTDKPEPGDAGRSEAQRAEDARLLSERIAQNAHTLVDRTVERVAPVVDRLKSRVAEAGTALHHSADQLVELQDRWIDDSRGSIRRHPLTWVCTAFAVGMVLGRMRSDR